MGKHLKILGLSLLALVSVLAVSASAAQANWQLLQNKAVVSSLNLKGSSTEDGELLVANGIQIHCSESSGTATVSGGGTATLTGTATVTFHGCFELTFGSGPEPACETHSVGQPDGLIKASGKGKGGMVSAEEVYLQSEKELFTTVEFTGPECPLAEIDGRTTGKVKITALTALQDTTSHVVHIEATELEFGEEPAEIDNETGGHVILGTIQSTTPNATFAAHLVGL
jgi:hypothetical protein